MSINGAKRRTGGEPGGGDSTATATGIGATSDLERRRPRPAAGDESQRQRGRKRGTTRTAIGAGGGGDVASNDDADGRDALLTPAAGAAAAPASSETWVTDARVILASFVMFLALVLAVVIVVFVENHGVRVPSSPIGTNNADGDGGGGGSAFGSGSLRVPVVMAGSPGGATQAIAPQATALASAAAAQHTHGIFGKDPASDYLASFGASGASAGWPLPPPFSTNANNANDTAALESRRRARGLGAEEGGANEAVREPLPPQEHSHAHATARPHSHAWSWKAGSIGSSSSSGGNSLVADAQVLSEFDALRVPATDVKRGVAHRSLTLLNGVRVVLSSDPDTRKAAAAVNVRPSAKQNADPPAQISQERLLSLRLSLLHHLRLGLRPRVLFVLHLPPRCALGVETWLPARTAVQRCWR
jgi:hypothetical protein